MTRKQRVVGNTEGANKNYSPQQAYNRAMARWEKRANETMTLKQKAEAAPKKRAELRKKYLGTKK